MRNWGISLAVATDSLSSILKGQRTEVEDSSGGHGLEYKEQ